MLSLASFRSPRRPFIEIGKDFNMKHRSLFRGLATIILLVGSLAFGFAPSQSVPHVGAAGSTCSVAGSGGDYTTIQAAVNDANCGTINVAAGTYRENVTIARAVTINGA